MDRTTHNVVTNKQTNKQTYRINNMKTKIISKILLTLTLAFVLGSTITHVNGTTQGNSASPIGPPPPQFPVVTIHTVNASGVVTASGSNGSIEKVIRGQIGAFVLSETPQI